MSGKSQTIGDFAVSRPSQVLSGTNREKKEAFLFFQFVPDHPRLSGNCEIPDRLGFSRHMKTRLTDLEFGIW